MIFCNKITNHTAEKDASAGGVVGVLRYLPQAENVLHPELTKSLIGGLIFCIKHQIAMWKLFDFVKSAHMKN